MSLYLAVFEDSRELDGVEIGSYGDYDDFLDLVTGLIENGVPGSQCPTLVNHSDCQGEWTPAQAALLEKELEAVAAQFRSLPPADLESEWKKRVAAERGLRIETLYDCFFDVDGEPLIDRLIGLCKLSQARNTPILFQ